MGDVGLRQGRAGLINKIRCLLALSFCLRLRVQVVEVVIWLPELEIGLLQQYLVLGLRFLAQ